ncbi:MAG TPA: glycosyl hydrolase family 28 protein [Candidatus Binatia bacterium]|nr:glycosyl hydrolase family 28 protein [Candidatus Binatia bacterium]
MTKQFLRILTSLALLSLTSRAATLHSARDYGAKGDGVSKDTAAVQAAIDSAEQEGGGEVMLPPGNYLCGTIHLKSNVTLHLVSGAALIASRDEVDFDPYEKLSYPIYDDKETTYFHYALLVGENVHHVALTGTGTIDGNRSKRGGPKTVAFKNCQHLSLRDLTIRNSPNYTLSFLGCDYVDVDGVTILNGYADGIDPDNCRFVRIANCFVDSWDDAICPKASLALGQRRATEHLVVTNCVLRTACSNFKFGTESEGDFRNIAFNNCVMVRRESGRGAISGISIESVDGAHIQGVVISNVSMQDVITPIFLRLGGRGRGQSPPAPGSLENVSISNLVAVGGSIASSVTGIPGYPIRGVSLENINITMTGEGEFSGLSVPELPGKYPEADMFGPLPAYALYARHAEGLTLRNVKTRWQEEDNRPALVLDEIRDLEVSGFRSETFAGAQPMISFNQVMDALVQGCRLSQDVPMFLRISGARSRAITLAGNDLRRAQKAVDLASEVEKSALVVMDSVAKY